MESLSFMLMTSDIVSIFVKYDPHESALLLLIHGRVSAIDDTAGTQITEDDIESVR